MKQLPLVGVAVALQSALVPAAHEFAQETTLI